MQVLCLDWLSVVWIIITTQYYIHHTFCCTALDANEEEAIVSVSECWEKKEYGWDEVHSSEWLCEEALTWSIKDSRDSPSSRTKSETSLCLIIKFQWKDSEIYRRLMCMRFVSSILLSELRRSMSSQAVPSKEEDKGSFDSDRWLPVLHKRPPNGRFCKVSHLMDGCLQFSMVLKLSWYQSKTCRRRQNIWRSPVSP